MQRIYEVRQEFGDVYATVISDDLVVPWRPLSLADFLQYELAVARGVILPEILEDEIFRKCVVDQTLVRRINKLPAGVISSVVVNILRFSGPPYTATEFNEDLDAARALINTGSSGVLKDIISTITLAYQYTPTQIMDMPYEQVLKVTALAEEKLLAMGAIEEPLHVEENEPEERPGNDRVATGNQPLDAKKLWEQQQQGGQPPPRRKKKSKMSRAKWWDKSPILEAEKRKKINFDREANAFNETHLDTHDKQEHPIVQRHIIEQKIGSDRDKMVTDAQEIYGEVLDALEAEGDTE
tara:strand:+ start:789 stop:1676 length:888 start_codon:yes stop_codon:yes gene_type:complete